MKISKFVKSAIATAVLAGSAVGAFASTSFLGTVSVGVPQSFSAFGSISGGSGTFSDTFNFTLGAGTASSGYSAERFDFDLGPFFSFKSLLTSVSLYSTNGTGSSLTGTGDDALVAQALSPTSAGIASLSFGNVATGPGTYYLKVGGLLSNPTGNGYFYTGSISSSTIAPAVSPVPEPETYAMLLAGLGLMGAIARRRNKA